MFEQEKDGTAIIRNEQELITIKSGSAKKYKIGFSDSSFNNNFNDSLSPLRTRGVRPVASGFPPETTKHAKNRI